MADQTVSKISIRPEIACGLDASQIRDVIQTAFAAKSHLDHQEAEIVDSLRKSGALSISLLAFLHEEHRDTMIGHVAASPILINGVKRGWYGLGPVSVRPAHQGQGIGSALVEGSLKALQGLGAAGCVVAGSPKYYQRFSFEHDPAMTFEGAPAKSFQRIILNGPAVDGEITYHDAFKVS
ncbi:hypothetical protein DOTSEDRAFT_48196 [Dothistroma septosporum NZE10]|uniref:N-acetyltransferase domain-containing protein n=1 Tax=Dothistroma septosporum (strain NZE10 / CBS 128990) TaxID=675120 RepID=M2YIA5_DOTSN|nr:hypothetical protein DOTSEDRAFT_48196 [Dothistroma septosporum NZE10]